MKTANDVQRNQRIGYFYSGLVIVCSLSYIAVSLSAKSIAQHFGISKDLVSFVGMLLIFGSAAASLGHLVRITRVRNAQLMAAGKGAEIATLNARDVKRFFSIFAALLVPIIILGTVFGIQQNRRYAEQRAEASRLKAEIRRTQADTVGYKANIKKLEKLDLRLKNLKINIARLDAIKSPALRNSKSREYRAQLTQIERESHALSTSSKSSP